MPPSQDFSRSQRYITHGTHRTALVVGAIKLLSDGLESKTKPKDKEIELLKCHDFEVKHLGCYSFSYRDDSRCSINKHIGRNGIKELAG